jgi:hypothetical protein
MNSATTTPISDSRATLPVAPFTILRRIFLRRFLDNELLSFGAEAGPQMLIWIAALVFAPVLLMPFGWMGRYAWAFTRPPDVVMGMRWDDGMRLIQLSMMATGLVTALAWEALLLDRRDVLVLAPLPVSWWTVIRAKCAALLTAWGCFALAFNLPSSILFPAIALREGGGAYAAFFVTQLSIGLAASAFVFASFIALQAWLLNTVSATAFRRLIMAVQAAAFFGMLMLIVWRPTLSPAAWSHALEAGSGSALRWFPPVWFLGLAETWRGSGSEGFRQAGQIAIGVLGASLLLAATGYVLGFPRHVRRTIESPEVRVSGATGHVSRVGRAVAHTIVRDPVERATFDFILRSLARSPRHRLLVGGAVGVGSALSLPSLLGLLRADPGAVPPVPSATALALPMAVSFLMLVSLRAGFRLPTDMAAAWVIRMAERANPQPYFAGTRKAMFVAGVLPPFVLCLPLYARLWGTGLALAHALFGALTGMLLVNVMLVRFRSLPYACAPEGIVEPRPARWQVYLFGFLLYLSLTSAIEHRLLADPGRFAIACAVLAGASVAVDRYRRLRGVGRGLVFDIESPNASVSLNIGPLTTGSAAAVPPN